ncbi:Glycosyltransferase involved in cell wall bisynthesis [Pedobacter sp. ok626]|uniref:glycosyltransferase n=1 Tax=Pedobacter sp. ok626 TaxID=1761882 RepID=UPI00088D9AFD|nr:glycosyltransferase [Pedobacter sp. ok626]SDJ57087.1 Glycosyltransferase involved in cell wall bisynthesis [Pedobacter sp. ok626]
MKDKMDDKHSLRGYDIIVIGQQPWDTEIGSNCKNIAIEFSKSNRVLYVNSPLDRITLYRNKKDEKILKRLNVINGSADGLVPIQDNIWNLYPDCMVESINWLFGNTLFDIANKYNNYKFASAIKRAIKLLGFKKFILFNDNEMFKGFYLKDYLNPFLSIYYSRDYMLAVDYWKRHGEKFEPKLIAKSDVCVANSVFLADYCRKYNPASFYVGQGCELDLFEDSKYPVPPTDLAGITGPVIGYVGALESIRLDLEIIRRIATEKPEWSVVLVGPEDDLFKSSELHQLSNVFFTGIKPVRTLPAYIKQFDVCINPQLLNMVTIGNYPRKIDEYLAMGKPVVATNTKAMEAFSDFVYLADSKDDYVTLIEKALKQNNTELARKRRAFALEHTWENSVSSIYKAISSYL